MVNFLSGVTVGVFGVLFCMQYMGHTPKSCVISYEQMILEDINKIRPLIKKINKQEGWV